VQSASSAVGVDLGKLAVEREQHLVDDATDQAPRMLRRNTVLKINIREKFTTSLIRTAHPSLPIGKNSGIRFAQPRMPPFSVA
jgi:hypothetical protein